MYFDRGQRTCVAAVRAGELPEQPFPQLPALLLRNADDVRRDAPVSTDRRAQPGGHGRATDGVRLP